MDLNISGPLNRYLPPLTGNWLPAGTPPATWLLDPFASSPLLPVQYARTGARVLTAAGNPIVRFLLELLARPPAESELRAALADLSMVRKDGEHLEKHLNQLYLTRCVACKREIPAQAFTWDAKTSTLLMRIYTCPACGDQGEHPIEEEDLARATLWANAEALHRARALERVASRDDPDRANAEEALQMYQPRAIYALGTIINKLDGMTTSPERRRCITALLLYAFDQANNLWPHHGERHRPRQLSLPGVFRETNVWLALENGIKHWSTYLGQPALHVSIWPEEPDETGGLGIFEGPLRDWGDELKEIPIRRAAGIFPRPNQAFWTLSALWSGWLWGRQAVAPFKPALRRRRYDWQWHAEALRSLLTHMRQSVLPETTFYGIIPELEADFLSAIFFAIQASGWSVSQFEPGKKDETATITLILSSQAPRKPMEPSLNLIRKAAREFLEQRASPADYLNLHSAILTALAARQALPWQEDSVALLKKKIHEALLAPEFTDLDGRTNPETGRWALARWQSALLQMD